MVFRVGWLLSSGMYTSSLLCSVAYSISFIRNLVLLVGMRRLLVAIRITHFLTHTLQKERSNFLIFVSKSR